MQTALSDTLAANRAGLQITSLSNGSMEGVNVGTVIANGGSKPLTINADTSVTGPYSSSYTIGLSDDQSILGRGNAASGTFQLNGMIVDNRVVTATPVDFGLLHVGQSGNASTTLSTTGDNNHFTAATNPAAPAAG